MRRRLSPPQLAAKTARWAVTMARWAIRYSTSGKRPHTKNVTRWQVVAFPGPRGGESRGIVDVLAIRKDHRPASRVFARGDLFEIVLIQVKGGGAAWPRAFDIDRLRAVQAHHHARAVVLVVWMRGAGSRFFTLSDRIGVAGKNAWREVDPCSIFGEHAVPRVITAAAAGKAGKARDARVA